MTTPIGVALLFLMAVAPALPWRATSGEVLRRRLLVPAWFGVGVMAVAVVLGVDDVWTLLTFGLAAFAVGGIVRQFAIGFRAQHHAGTSWWRAPGRTIRGGPRLYGGLIVHAGIVAIAVALAASTSFTTKDEARLGRGETAEVAGYTFTYLRREVVTSDQKTTIKAQIRIERGDRDLGTYAPAVSTFPGAMSGIGTPSVKTGPLRDIYLTLVSAPTDRDRVTIGIAINPMVVWIWIGGGLLAIGTAVALLPKSRRVVVPPSAGDTRGAGDGPDPADPDGLDDRDARVTVDA
jgi:cytochrome c-type biogenesis protein CcmF